MKDSLQRFIFQDIDIRGETVHLDQSWLDILENKEYPEIIQSYMGQLMTATVLLAAIIKIDGSISIQANSDGAVNLLMTECRHDLSIRCVTQYNEDKLQAYLENYQLSDEPLFSELFNNGSLVITVTQKDGNRYQGIVNIKGDSIAEILENHLTQSEQINTRLYLSSQHDQCAGLLLQQMPSTSDNKKESWEEISILGNTLSEKELLQLDPETIITRLFNSFDVRLFDPQAIHFQCSCSEAKVSQMLTSLDYHEARQMVEQSEFIEVCCEFCGKAYRFGEIEIAEIFAPKENQQYH